MDKIRKNSPRKGKSHIEIFGLKRAEEIRVKMSLNGSKFWKGKRLHENTLKAAANSNRGKHHTEDHKKKISMSTKGRICSEETKRKMSLFQKGKIISPETRLKISNKLKGVKHSESRKHHFSQVRTGREVSQITRAKISESEKGKIISKDTRAKISQSLKTRYAAGLVAWAKGKSPSSITRAKISIYRSKQIFPMKDTKIEVKIQNYLKQLGITFFPHYYIQDIKYAYQCDIFIPNQEGIEQCTIIECDGDYWHGNTKLFDFRKMPKNIKEQIPLDFERTAQLQEAGYRVIRLWENQINKMSISEFKEILASNTVTNYPPFEKIFLN